MDWELGRSSAAMMREARREARWAREPSKPGTLAPRRAAGLKPAAARGRGLRVWGRRVELRAAERTNCLVAAGPRTGFLGARAGLSRPTPVLVRGARLERRARATVRCADERFVAARGIVGRAAARRVAAVGRTLAGRAAAGRRAPVRLRVGWKMEPVHRARAERRGRHGRPRFGGGARSIVGSPAEARAVANEPRVGTACVESGCGTAE